MRTYKGIFLLIWFVAVIPIFISPPVLALVINFTGPNSLSANADFTFSGTTLNILLTNTSTGVPLGFSNSDQLLTSIAFDLPGLMTITGGSVVVGTGSTTINFDTGTYEAGSDISGEWGYGNLGTTGFGSLVNFVSANQSGTTAFPGANLDGPAPLNGPQGGLTNGIVALGGLGAVQNSVYISLNLSGSLIDLSFLSNGAVIEFGSDAAFVHRVPEPGILILLGIGIVAVGIASRRMRKI